MDVAVSLVVNAMSTGAAYAFIALSFTLVVNSSGVFNFAVGHQAMLGALVYVSLAGVFGVAIAAGMTLVAMAATGALLYLLILRKPERVGGNPLVLVVITLGVSVVIENGVGFFWGSYPRQAPALLGGSVTIAGTQVFNQRFLLIVASVVATAAVVWIQKRTLVGKAMVAIGFDRISAQIYGINDAWMQAFSWGFAMILAAFGGLLLAPVSSASMALAFPLAVQGFSAAIIGGLGSGVGPLIGGFLLGFIETGIGLVYPGWESAITYALLFLVLMARPTGLLGGNAVLLRGPRA